MLYVFFLGQSFFLCSGPVPEGTQGAGGPPPVAAGGGLPDRNDEKGADFV